MLTEAKNLNTIPYEWFQQKRTDAPIWFDETSKMWNVFRYDDVFTVLTHPTLYSSQSFAGPRLPSIMGMDDPRHRKLRLLAFQAFTPTLKQNLVPHITEVMDSLLDALIPNGEMDLARDLAYPLPTLIIAEILGIPTQDQAKFRVWSDVMSNNTPDNILPSPEQQKWAIQSFFDYFSWQIKEHKREPREDVISRLLAAEVEGEKLTEQELFDVCVLLMVAGNETTASLISHAMIAFEEHPRLMPDLRADLSLLPGAIEEILRCYPPIGASQRFTTQDVTLGGVPIPARQVIFFRIASANMDESHFANPLSFDVRRNPNKHLSFGQGIHFCLGSTLARVEAKVALTRLLQRFTTLEGKTDQPPTTFEAFFSYGVRSYPVTFQVAKSV